VTVQDIIDRAQQYSNFNDDPLVDPPSIINRVFQRLVEVFGMANELASRRVAYFGKLVEVTATNGTNGWGWTKPTDADVVLYTTAGTPAGAGVLTPGEEVFVVPNDNFNLADPPRLYPVGKEYLSVGTATDPVAADPGDKIRFFYARFPASLDDSVAADDVANTIDADLPEGFAKLLDIDLAMWFALKDNRFTIDGPGLTKDMQSIEASFALHVQRHQRALLTQFGDQGHLDPTVR
jgi:hypothetical protein